MFQIINYIKFIFAIIKLLLFSLIVSIFSTLNIYNGHDDNIREIKIATANSIIVSDDSYNIVCWDIEKLKRIFSVIDNSNYQYYFSFDIDLDDNLIISIGPKNFNFWKNGKLYKQIAHQKDHYYFTDIKIIKNTKSFITADKNGNITIYNYYGDVLNKIKYSNIGINEIHYYGKLKVFLLIISDGSIKILNSKFNIIKEFSNSVNFYKSSINSYENRIYFLTNDSSIKEIRFDKTIKINPIVKSLKHDFRSIEINPRNATIIANEKSKIFYFTMDGILIKSIDYKMDVGNIKLITESGMIITNNEWDINIYDNNGNFKSKISLPDYYKQMITYIKHFK